MKRGKIFRRFIPYLALLIIFVGIIASAAVQTVTWTHDTGWTRSDGTTGNFTPGEMDTLIYKLYVDNPVYVPGKSGTGYIGEATGVFSMNLDIPQAAAAQGIVANPGDNLTLVMTASFVDMDGETYTSPKSQSTAFTVPFPPGRVPVRPSAPNL